MFVMFVFYNVLMFVFYNVLMFVFGVFVMFVLPHTITCFLFPLMFVFTP